MQLPGWKTSAWLFYGGVCVSGLAAVGLSLSALWEASPFDGSWMFLAIPLVLLRRTYIQLPNCDGRICPSGLFVLYAGLAWGPEQAALLAVLDAALNSLEQTAQHVWRLLFNLAVLPLAIFTATHTSLLVEGTGIFATNELLLRAAVTTLLYYGLNLGLVLGMIALTAGRAALSSMRSALLFSWAEYLIGGLAATTLALAGADLSISIAVGVGVLALTGRTLNHYFGVLREREAALADKEHLLREKEHLLEEVRATHLSTLETLALAIEAKDPATHGHIRRVQRLSDAIGQKLGMPLPDLEALRIAALLHDIGKLAIPEYLLYRNRKLTAEDEQKLRNHARLGADILRHSRLDPQVMSIVRHHHERYDGTGYPFGLMGEDTILGARVLAVADAWDKLRHPQEGPVLPGEDVLARIREESGYAFDPAVVRALSALTPAVLEAVEQDSLASSPTTTQGGSPTTTWPGRPSFVTDFYSSHREARAIYSLNADIRGTAELEPSLRLMAQALNEVAPSSAILAFLPSPAGDELELVYSEGIAPTELERLPSQRWLNLLRVCRDGSRRRADEPVCGLLPELARYEGGRSGAFTTFVLPLNVAEIGLVLLCHPEEFSYAEEQGRIINLLLKEAGPAIANARFYERFRRESLTDALTGLANARALRQQGQALILDAIRRNRGGAVVVLDLNGFKQINDTLGHHQGDRLLVQVARALVGQVRTGDLVARNGGDEFVLVVPGIGREELRERLETLHHEVCQLWPDGWDLGNACTSAGVAWFAEEGVSLEELMQLADTRMYVEKRARKGLGLTLVRGGVRDVARVVNG